MNMNSPVLKPMGLSCVACFGCASCGLCGLTPAILSGFSTLSGSNLA
jgi:hypothetical protein